MLTCMQNRLHILNFPNWTSLFITNVWNIDLKICHYKPKLVEGMWYIDVWFMQKGASIISVPHI